MSIRSSSATEVERLVIQLHSHNPTERDAAIARLRVIGVRALAPLLALAGNESASPDARVAALRTIEDLDDARARDAAAAAAGSALQSVAIAALAVLRPWLARDNGPLLDRMTALALDDERDVRVRLAIVETVSELPGANVGPLRQRIAAATPPVIPGALPGDPDGARAWLADRQERPLPTLHDFVAHARQQEQQARDRGTATEWLAARGAAHARLAARGSTVALYDLRETLDAARTPLPLDFLVAIGAIGDASCLEPMAHAWAASGDETWWRDRLAAAARDITQRARLTGRSGVIKRIRSKYPGFLSPLSTPSP